MSDAPDTRAQRELEEGIQRDFSQACPTAPTSTSTGCCRRSTRAASRSSTTSCCSSSSTRRPSCGSSCCSTSCARPGRCWPPTTSPRRSSGWRASSTSRRSSSSSGRCSRRSRPSEYAQIRPVPRDELGVPELPVPRRRVPARQQERRHGAGLRPRPDGARALLRQLLEEPSALRRVPALPRPPRLRHPADACSSATSPSPTGSTTASSTSSPACTPTRPSTGASTRPARSSSTSRTTSSMWRFRHLQVVTRTIGHKTGTGGSSRRRLPAPGARPDVLPRAVCGAHPDRGLAPVLGSGLAIMPGPRRATAWRGVDPLGWAAVRWPGRWRDVASEQATCVVVGGGPAGMVLGLLLARAGVEVSVLEKHGDFLRDFRGDTVHPSTLQLLDELGLGERFASLPQSRLYEVGLPGRRPSQRGRGRLPPAAGAPPLRRDGAPVGPAEPARRRRRGTSRPSRCGCAPR